MRTNLVILVSALTLCGCATSSLKMAPPAPDRPWSPTVDSSGALTAAPSSVQTTAPAQGYVLPPNPAATALPPAPTIDREKTHQLADLIDLAQSINPETRIAWNDARNAALAAGIARSAYLPRISATALTGRQNSHGDGSNSRSTLNGSIEALSLEWLLFDFGQRKALVDAADQNAVIANIAFTSVHQKLIHVVSVAFYTYSAARARADSAAASLADAREIQAAAESRRQHGVGTVVEVAQARQLAAQAELAKVRADGEQSDTYVALLAAVGLSPLAQLRIADISQRPLPSDLNVPLDRVLANALQHRPDVLGAIAAQKVAEAGVRAAKADFLPKIFLSASGSHTGGNINVTALPGVGNEAPTVNLSNHQWSSSIMLGLTVPIYSGGTRNAALAQARNRADSAEEALERVKLGAAQEIATADSRLRTSLAAVAASQALLDASKTTYDAALASFKHGVGSSTDVLAADRQLLEARNAAADAHSAALSAAATLALVCGDLGAAPN